MKLFGTKELTEIERVEQDLANAEEALQEKLFQLGQLFYQKHQNDSTLEPEYANMVDMITKLDENRKGFYQNKLRLMGKMMCLNCGEIIPYGSVYCSFCGQKANEKNTSTQNPENQQGAGLGLICSNCGTELEAGTLFCPSCGTKTTEK